MTSWTNWAKTTTCNPEHILFPNSQKELKDIVVSNLEKLKPLKVVGNSGSYNSNFHTDGNLISLKHLNKVLDIDVKNKTISAEAGISIPELIEAASKYDLGLSSLGTNLFDTIGGSCSVGHHGSGKNYGILSSYLENFELLSSQGNIHVIHKGDELYNALGVNLGAAGILTSLTIKLEPRFKLKMQVYPIELEEFEEKFKTLLEVHDHVKLIWAPHTKTYQCWVADRFKTDQEDNFLHWKTNVIDGLLVNNLYHAGLLYLANFNPKLVRKINKHLANYFLKPVGARIGWGDDIFYLPHLLKQDAVEYAFDWDQTVSFMKEIDSMIELNNYNVQFPIEVRFVKQDSFWMSPAYKKNMCYVGTKCHLLPGLNPSYIDYFKDVSSLVETFKGRPHWGKQIYMSPDYLKLVFDKYTDFWSLCNILDPNGLFENNWIQSIKKNGPKDRASQLKNEFALA